MKWLIFGTGWIATQVHKYLQMLDEESTLSSRHFTDFQEVKEFLEMKRPDRIVCAVGRTHGEGFTTIDYLEQAGKLPENLESNLVVPIWIAQATNVPILYFGTGCIYQYDSDFHSENSNHGYLEQDLPNFTGSSYSAVKRATDLLMQGFPHVLNARIRMPITLESHPRDFITKIMGYTKITSIRNSMTVLEDILPRLLALLYEARQLGTYNAVNSGPMTHEEILTLFGRDPSSYILESQEDQSKRLLSKRSNNHLETIRLEGALERMLPETKKKFFISESLPRLQDSLLKIMKYRKQKRNFILVTGGFGFIASNFINIWMKNHPDDFIVNVDRIDTCSNTKNIENKYNLQYIEYRTDIKNTQEIYDILERHSVNYVFHFAAETHVDNSFGNSLSFTHSNVLGTHSLLEACREYSSIQRFYHMSTDEVYGEIKEGAFHEKSLLHPTNPYAATKAAAEQIVHSYGCSFELPYIILRANNIYGIRQYPEKVIPAFITRFLQGKKIRIQGDGSAKRMFLHVDDLINAVEIIHQRGVTGEIYNIGTKEEYTVLELAQILFTKIADEGRFEDWIEYIPDRLFNDCRYSIDTTKIENLGWHQEKTLHSSLDEILDWYRKNLKTWQLS
jgi:dTDP-glucose 4,6-dehydratase